MRNKNRVLTILRVIFTLCLFATIAFIFLNSSEIGAVSGGKSAVVTEWLNKVMAKLPVNWTFTEYQVRKLAHFSEYMLLGFWLMLTLRIYTKRLLSHISWPLFLGLFIAVADETYQLTVPDRSGQVLDVVIDFTGVLAGLCCALFILLLFRAFWEELQSA